MAVVLVYTPTEFCWLVFLPGAYTYLRYNIIRYVVRLKIGVAGACNISGINIPATYVLRTWYVPLTNLYEVPGMGLCLVVTTVY